MEDRSIEIGDVLKATHTEDFPRHQKVSEAYQSARNLLKNQFTNLEHSKELHKSTEEKLDITAKLVSDSLARLKKTKVKAELKELRRNAGDTLKEMEIKREILLKSPLKLEALNILLKNSSDLIESTSDIIKHATQKLLRLEEKEKGVLHETHKLLANEKQWIVGARNIFSLDLMTYEDEIKMAEKLHEKTTYQKQIPKHKSKLKNIKDKCDELLLKDVVGADEVVSIYRQLETESLEVIRLSEEQDAAFESAMSEEGSFYSQLEELYTWMEKAGDVLQQSEEDPSLSEHHEVLVLFETYSQKFLNLCQQSVKISKTRSTFDAQMEQIKGQWNDICHHLTRLRRFKDTKVIKDEQCKILASTQPLEMQLSNIDNLIEQFDAIEPMDEKVKQQRNEILHKRKELESAALLRDKMKRRYKEEVRKVVVSVEEYVIDVDDPDYEHVIEILYNNQSKLESASNSMQQMKEDGERLKEVLPLDDYREFVECVTEVEEIFYEKQTNHDMMGFIVQADKQLRGVQIIVNGFQDLDKIKEEIQVKIQAIDENQRSLRRLKKELSDSLERLTTIDHEYYPLIVHSMMEKIKGALPLIHLHLESLQCTADDCREVLVNFMDATKQAEDYLENLHQTETFYFDEMEKVDCLYNTKVVLSTVSTAISDHRHTLEKMLTYCHLFVERFPDKKRRTLMGCLESCRNKTYEFEDMLTVQDALLNKKLVVFNGLEVQLHTIHTAAQQASEMVSANTPCNVNAMRTMLFDFQGTIDNIVSENKWFIKELPAKDNKDLTGLVERVRLFVDNLEASLKDDSRLHSINEESVELIELPNINATKVSVDYLIPVKVISQSVPRDDNIAKQLLFCEANCVEEQVREQESSYVNTGDESFFTGLKDRPEDKPEEDNKEDRFNRYPLEYQKVTPEKKVEECDSYEFIDDSPIVSHEKELINQGLNGDNSYKSTLKGESKEESIPQSRTPLESEGCDPLLQNSLYEESFSNFLVGSKKIQDPITIQINGEMEHSCAGVNEDESKLGANDSQSEDDENKKSYGMTKTDDVDWTTTNGNYTNDSIGQITHEICRNSDKCGETSDGVMKEKVRLLKLALNKHLIVVDDLKKEIEEPLDELEDMFEQNRRLSTIFHKHKTIYQLLCQHYRNEIAGQLDEILSSDGTDSNEIQEIEDLIVRLDEEHAEFARLLEVNAQQLNDCQDVKFEVEQVLLAVKGELNSVKKRLLDANELDTLDQIRNALDILKPDLDRLQDMIDFTEIDTSKLSPLDFHLMEQTMISLDVDVSNLIADFDCAEADYINRIKSKQQVRSALEGIRSDIVDLGSTLKRSKAFTGLEKDELETSIEKQYQQISGASYKEFSVRLDGLPKSDCNDIETLKQQVETELKRLQDLIPTRELVKKCIDPCCKAQLNSSDQSVTDSPNKKLVINVKNANTTKITESGPIETSSPVKHLTNTDKDANETYLTLNASLREYKDENEDENEDESVEQEPSERSIVTSQTNAKRSTGVQSFEVEPGETTDTFGDETLRLESPGVDPEQKTSAYGDESNEADSEGITNTYGEESVGVEPEGTINRYGKKSLGVEPEKTKGAYGEESFEVGLEYSALFSAYEFGFTNDDFDATEDGNYQRSTIFDHAGDSVTSWLESSNNLQFLQELEEETDDDIPDEVVYSNLNESVPSLRATLESMVSELKDISPLSVIERMSLSESVRARLATVEASLNSVDVEDSNSNFEEFQTVCSVKITVKQLLSDLEMNLKEQVAKKKSHDVCIETALCELEEIEELNNAPVVFEDEGILLSDRIHMVERRLERLHTVDELVRSIFEEGAVFHLLPTLDQDHLERQFTMFVARYRDIEESLENQVQYLTKRLHLKENLEQKLDNLDVDRRGSFKEFQLELSFFRGVLSECEKTAFDLRIAALCSDQSLLPVQHPTVEVESSPIEQRPTVEFESSPIEQQETVEVETSPMEQQPTIEVETFTIEQRPIVEVEAFPIEQQPTVEIETSPIEQQETVEVESSPIEQQETVEVDTSPIEQRPIVEVETSIIEQQPTVEIEASQIEQEPTIGVGNNLAISDLEKSFNKDQTSYDFDIQFAEQPCNESEVKFEEISVGETLVLVNNSFPGIPTNENQLVDTDSLDKIPATGDEDTEIMSLDQVKAFVLETLERAVNKLNDYERIDVENFDDISEILDSLDDLDMESTRQEISNCQVLLTSLSGSLKAEESEDLQVEITSLLECFQETGEEMNKRFFDFRKALILQTDYEEDLSRLSDRLTQFRETNEKQEPEMSLNAMHRQLVKDKGVLGALQKELKPVQEQRIKLSEHLPMKVFSELSLMEVELQEELSAVVSSIAKEESYLEDLQATKRTLSLTILKQAGCIESFKNESKRPENEGIDHLRKGFESLKDDWDAIKPVIKASYKNLPPEDGKELLAYSNHLDEQLNALETQITSQDLSCKLLNQKLSQWKDGFESLKESWKDKNSLNYTKELAKQKQMTKDIEKHALDLGVIDQNIDDLSENAPVDKELIEKKSGLKLSVENLSHEVKSLWMASKENLKHLEDGRTALDQWMVKYHQVKTENEFEEIKHFLGELESIILPFHQDECHRLLGELKHQINQSREQVELKEKELLQLERIYKSTFNWLRTIQKSASSVDHHVKTIDEWLGVFNTTRADFLNEKSGFEELIQLLETEYQQDCFTEKADTLKNLVDGVETTLAEMFDRLGRDIQSRNDFQSSLQSLKRYVSQLEELLDLVIPPGQEFSEALVLQSTVEQELDDLLVLLDALSTKLPSVEFNQYRMHVESVKERVNQSKQKMFDLYTNLKSKEKVLVDVRSTVEAAKEDIGEIDAVIGRVLEGVEEVTPTLLTQTECRLLEVSLWVSSCVKSKEKEEALCQDLQELIDSFNDSVENSKQLLKDLREKIQRYEDIETKVNTLESLVVLIADGSDERRRSYQGLNLEQLTRELNEIGQQIECANLVEKQREMALSKVESVKEKCSNLLEGFCQVKLEQRKFVMDVISEMKDFLLVVSRDLPEDDEMLAFEPMNRLSDLLNTVRVHHNTTGEMLQKLMEFSISKGEDEELLVQINETKDDLKDIRDVLHSTEGKIMQEISVGSLNQSRCQDMEIEVTLLSERQKVLERSLEEEWQVKESVEDVMVFLNNCQETADSLSKDVSFLVSHGSILRRNQSSFNLELDSILEKLELKQTILVDSIAKLKLIPQKLLKILGKIDCSYFQQTLEEYTTSVDEDPYRIQIRIAYTTLVKRRTKLNNLLVSGTDRQKRVFLCLPKIVDTLEKIETLERDFEAILKDFEMLSMNQGDVTDTTVDDSFYLGDVLKEEEFFDTGDVQNDLNRSFGLKWSRQEVDDEQDALTPSSFSKDGKQIEVFNINKDHISELDEEDEKNEQNSIKVIQT